MGIGPSVSRASGHPSRARASRGAGSRRGARRFRAARTRIRVAERRGSLPRLFAPGYGRDASRFRHDASRYGHNSRMRVCASDSDAEATRMPGARRPHPSRIRVCVGPRPVLGPFWVWTLAGPYTHTHTHTHDSCWPAAPRQAPPPGRVSTRLCRYLELAAKREATGGHIVGLSQVL